MKARKGAQVFIALPVLLVWFAQVRPSPPSRFTSLDASLRLAPGAVPLRQGPTWTVDPRPELTVGVVEGPDEYVLYQVRDATVLSDGALVAAMHFRNFFELRYFDSTGTHIASAGRYGEGPFEMSGRGFGCFSHLPGDSVMVVGEDHMYSVFGPRGERVRSGLLSLPPMSFAEGLLDKDHLGLISFHWGASSGQPNQADPSERISFQIHDLESGVTEEVGSVLSPSQGTVGETGLILRRPFGPSPQWAIGGGLFWFGGSGNGWIEGHSMGNGDEAIAIRTGRPSRAVTKEDQERWKELDLRGADDPDERRSIQRYHRGLNFPETLPFVQRLLVDRGGHLWVLQYEPPWSEAPFRWDVYTPEGEWEAEASIPLAVLGGGIRNSAMANPVLEIGADYLVILHESEDGVEHIMKYRLRKAHSARRQLF